MAGGFKIADAYVEVQTKDQVKADVSRIDSALKGIDDKIVQVKAQDNATPIITGVDSRKIEDKQALIEADDKASAAIEDVDSKSVSDKIVKVDADTGKADAKVKAVAGSAKPIDIPVDADTGPASDALDGLGALGAGIGDKFSGGMVGALSGGIAGAVAGLGMLLVEGIAEKISESNQIERSLSLKFETAGADIGKFSEMFATNFFEDFDNWVQNTMPFGEGMDQNIRALEEAGITTEHLAETGLLAKTAFSDFGKMAADDQRALIVELNKVAVGAGIDVPAALKGASTAAKTWGMSGWDATRLVESGFQRMDARGDDWAETLNEYSPHFKRLGLDGTSALNLIATGLEHGARNTDVMADSFKELGIRVVDGSVLSRGALSDLGLDVDKTMQAFSKGGPEAKAALDTVIDRLNAIQDPVERDRIGVALLGTTWEDTAKDVLGFMDVLPGTSTALDSSGVSARMASEKAAGLADAFNQLKMPFESAATTADLVSNALDRMSGKTPLLRDTTQAWNDLVREFKSKVDWDDSKGGVQGLSGALVDLRGEVNTTTAAGSKLEDWANTSKKAFMEQAGALREAGVPAEEMTDKLQVMRNAFIANAESQGLPKEAAIRLADAYGMVPNEVSTAIYAPNLLQRMGELNMLDGRIRTLPDGRFSVTADTGPAHHNITKLITDSQGKVITLRVTTTGASAGLIRNQAGGLPFLADGGPVIGPGTGTSDDVPLMGSNGEWMIRERVAKKNRSFLEWFNEYGDRYPIQSFAEGGPIGGNSGANQPAAPMGAVTNIYITPPPEMDYSLIAAKVSRYLELQRQGSG